MLTQSVPKVESNVYSIAGKDVSFNLIGVPFISSLFSNNDLVGSNCGNFDFITVKCPNVGLISSKFTKCANFDLGSATCENVDLSAAKCADVGLVSPKYANFLLMHC